MDLLPTIYPLFDPEPLRGGQQEMYVDLRAVRGEEEGIVVQLANTFRLASRPKHLVLTGHKGSGKSTELFHLKNDLATGSPKFFVVYLSAEEELDPFDADYPDVLLALIRVLLAELEKIGVRPTSETFLERTRNFVKSLRPFGIEVGIPDVLWAKAGDDKSISVGTTLASLKLVSRGSPDSRQVLRDRLEPSVGDWIKAANDILQAATLEIRKKGYERILLILDDLDKMILRPHATAGCDTGEYLYVRRGPQLTQLDCNVLYTMPIALYYSYLSTKLEAIYGEGNPLPVLPMVKVRKRPNDRKDPRVPERHEPGMDALSTMVRKRLESVKVPFEAVFDSEDRVRELIDASGGQPSGLMSLVRDASTTRGLPIVKESVESIIRKRRRSFEAFVHRKDYRAILETVRDTGELPQEEAKDKSLRELLDSRAILRYMNAEGWFDVNPLVRLER